MLTHYTTTHITGTATDIGGGAIGLYGKENQDKSIVDNEDEITCILDGHGIHCGIIAEQIKNLFTTRLSEKDFLDDLQNDPVQILHLLFSEAHSTLISFDRGGTTCTLTVIINEKLYIANVGDSTCIVFDKDGNLIAKSVDHDPLNREEISRIEESSNSDTGLFFARTNVSVVDYDLNNPKKIKELIDKGRTNKSVSGEWASIIRSKKNPSNSLAMTRSLGDNYMTSLGVIHVPTIQVFDLTHYPKYCIVNCTDGVWDNWKLEDLKDFVMNLIVQGKTPQKIANLLILENESRGKHNFRDARDNATAVVFVKK